MKRVLILTDSLSLPRDKPEVCEYENTWPALIKASGKHIVHQVSIGGATSSFLLKQLHYHAMFKPDIVILQMGIVDCAPRFANQFELEIINRLPFRKKILEKLNKPSVKKFRNLTYTPIKYFKNNLNKISRRLGNLKIVAIGIVPAVEAYEKVLPGVTNNIRSYNAILETSFTNFIDLSAMPAEGLMSDHHHINAAGHQYIFNRLKAHLNSV